MKYRCFLRETSVKLKNWGAIGDFLIKNLKIESYKEKTKIISLSKGVDFVGFRNIYYFKLLRKRNIKSMLFKIKQYKYGQLTKEKLLESFQGWSAYAKWADTLELRRKMASEIYKIIQNL